MEHEWKVGDWCEFRGVRYLVYRVSESGVWIVRDAYNGCGVNDNGHASPAKNNPDLKPLPDCDSWDWQPPEPVEPPEGYRLLEHGEQILQGDWYYEGRYWLDLPGSSCAINEKYSNLDHMPMARKIEPQYRPFKDHVEFWQYRNMWITRIDCAGNQTDGYWKILGADETGVWGQCDKVSYADLLAKHKFVEQVGVDYDATIPCGVKL